MRRARGSKPKKTTARELASHETYDALKTLLEEMGWTVSLSRSLEGRGGDCILRGQRRAIVAARLPVEERVEVLLEALRREDLEGRFIRPDLRELVEGGAPRGAR